MNIKLKAGLYTAGIVIATVTAGTLVAIAPQLFAGVMIAVIAFGLVRIVYQSVLEDLKRAASIETNEDTTNC